ncbi:tRNA (adenosine(37)-N6)-dimethylallyltransferase MiaA [Pasteuria penetrans]|uniref:tRNA (adenosine(37)-N6)-dimethylallyltransferase MiaA n=1 Tax=Pasteuria penetrans TaxID=86005 RepID=UPI000F9A6A33|nr:tRNA (adenosine(37)-N6)-dimethylallyltransferase MiaA [Pasteuria penetrans]
MRVLVIVGPTGVGKTALAVSLAQRLNGEVVSADAFQVYRGLQVGTAKPTLAEQQGISHHMLDLCDPWDVFPLFHYQRLACRAIASIHKRGRMPIVAGGTGLYIMSLLEGYRIPQVPPQPLFRSACMRYVERWGTLALHRVLQRRHSERAAGIHPHNVRRVIRALELALYSEQGIGQREKPAYCVAGVKLDVPMEILRVRLQDRLQSMIHKGWLAEMRWLRAQGASVEWPAMQAIGYREWLLYLDGRHTFSHTMGSVLQTTQRFVKKQRTWWRRWSDWLSVNPLGEGTVEKVLGYSEARWFG